MHTPRMRTRVAAGAVVLALLAAGCGDDKTTTTGGSLLKGMRGTTPLTDLKKLGNFTKDLDAAYGKPLKDLNYAAESYDIVNVLAISALVAKSDAPGPIATEIVNTTKDGEKCTDFASCKAIVDKGGNPDYEGTSGPTNLLPNGDPAEGSYGIMEFDGKDELQTKSFQIAKAAPGDGEGGDMPDKNFGPKADGVLTIGTVLPVTGNLGFLGPPEVAGVRLAVNQINKAGGVLGKPVKLIEGDSGDKSNQAFNGTVDNALAAKVDALVGAASSGVTLSFLGRVVKAGVIVFSPANTSKELSIFADKGLYYRLAPSDILQGQVLADLVAGDGHTDVAVLNLQDPYGTGLAEDFTKAFAATGGKVVAGGAISYKQDATNFDAEVQKVIEAKPEALVLIGFDESAKILKALIAQGKGPDKLPTYGVDGNMGNALVDALKGKKTG